MIVRLNPSTCVAKILPPGNSAELQIELPLNNSGTMAGASNGRLNGRITGIFI
jgi:hypothetical protein